jgi:hypothetical protein
MMLHHGVTVDSVAVVPSTRRPSRLASSNRAGTGRLGPQFSSSFLRIYIFYTSLMPPFGPIPSHIHDHRDDARLHIGRILRSGTSRRPHDFSLCEKEHHFGTPTPDDAYINNARSPPPRTISPTTCVSNPAGEPFSFSWNRWNLEGIIHS